MDVHLGVFWTPQSDFLRKLRVPFTMSMSSETVKETPDICKKSLFVVQMTPILDSIGQIFVSFRDPLAQGPLKVEHMSMHSWLNTLSEQIQCNWQRYERGSGLGRSLFICLKGHISFYRYGVPPAFIWLTTCNLLYYSWCNYDSMGTLFIYTIIIIPINQLYKYSQSISCRRPLYKQLR